MRYILSVLALLSFAGMAHGQGYNIFSGRNHPELEWRVAETEHFRITYPAHLQGIEAEAAAVAEETYAVLSANLDVTFRDKIRVYLSDEDEIANGFAVPLDNAYTNIWVHVNEFAETWTGREKWLRKVLAHELGHIFHYQATKSNIGYLGNLLSNPLPRFWTEGLAQYETETWDSERGDRWLRTAVLDDELSYFDGRSLWNGRLLYAVGNSQMRYFASTYGDTALTRLLKHRRKTLLGLGKVHDFYDAFQDVTGKPYERFYDEWRRHVNVYYNTVAGQVEPVDSLDVPPLAAPGAYYQDLRYSPDTALVAVLSTASLNRPIRRIVVVNRATKRQEVVAEGAIAAPISWSPDSRRIAYSRNTRGEHGSLVNDLYVVDADGGNRRRLTHSRRAHAPAFSPDGERIAFIGVERGTANVFLLDLASGEETQVTRFEGDVQLTGLRWRPKSDTLAFARFDADGRRDLVLLDLSTGEAAPIRTGAIASAGPVPVEADVDDRGPVWSPDGGSLAFTSRRDLVPNVFVYDLATGTERRVTHLATGAIVMDWYPPDSARTEGSLIVSSNVTKSNDKAYRIDAARTAPEVDVQVPEEYARWTLHRPPNEIPSVVPPDASLVQRSYEYDSWRNISHAATLLLPYYDSLDDFGVVGASIWLEPLAKHSFAFVGGLSFTDPWEKSLFGVTYTNNQFYPTLAFNVYRMPTSTRFYGSDLLVENFSGGDVTAIWPLDWSDKPYTSTTFETRLRYVDVDPIEVGAFDATSEQLPAPEEGQLADLRAAFTYKQQKPYRFATTHPLDGIGVRAEVRGAAPVLGADRRFVRGDLSAFGILKTVGLQRLFLYGRAQAQEGSSFAQDFVGLSRYDDFQVGIPGFLPFQLGETERVRGYRRYALGNRMLFGTAEYRVPLVPDLQTSLFGAVSLGSTALAAFADGGVVWTAGDFGEAERRVGLGLELKNALTIFGAIELNHALGVAQPAEFLGTGDEYEVYYRIRASVPF